MDYLGRILKFAMDILLKLCAPAKENELKNVYEKFQEELNGICETRESTNASFALVVIKGLHFILQQIQVIKKSNVALHLFVISLKFVAKPVAAFS